MKTIQRQFNAGMICAYLCASVALLCLAASAVAQAVGPFSIDIDGRTVPQWAPGVRDAIAGTRFRPAVVSQHGTVFRLANVHVAHVTNLKACNVTASAQGVDPVGPDKTLCFKSIVLDNLLIEDVHQDAAGRSAGLHNDALLIFGGDPANGWAPDLTITRSTFRGNGAGTMSTLIQGYFGTVTLRDLVYSGNVHAPMIDARALSIDTVILDNVKSDNGIVLQGLTGSIGRVIVKNSPGLVITQNKWQGQIPSPPISYEDAAAPTPATPAVPAAVTQPSPAMTEDRDIIIDGKRYRVINQP